MEKPNLLIATSALKATGQRLRKAQIFRTCGRKTGFHFSCTRDHRLYRARSTPLNLREAHHYA